MGQRDPVAVGEWLVSVLDDRVEFNADLHGYRRRTHGDDILPSVSLLAEMLSPAYRYDIYRNAEERAFDMERGSILDACMQAMMSNTPYDDKLVAGDKA